MNRLRNIARAIVAAHEALARRDAYAHDLGYPIILAHLEAKPLEVEVEDTNR